MASQLASSIFNPNVQGEDTILPMMVRRKVLDNLTDVDQQVFYEMDRGDLTNVQYSDRKALIREIRFDYVKRVKYRLRVWDRVRPLYKYDQFEYAFRFEIMHYACKYNSVGIIQMMYEHGYDLNIYNFQVAAKYGHVDVFHWAMEKLNYLWKHESVFYHALLGAKPDNNFNRKMVGFLYDYGCNVNTSVLVGAVESGHVGSLLFNMYIFEKKFTDCPLCVWPTQRDILYVKAVELDNPSMLIHLRTNDCPCLNGVGVFERALYMGFMDNVNYIKCQRAFFFPGIGENEPLMEISDMMKWAVMSGNRVLAESILDDIPNLVLNNPDTQTEILTSTCYSGNYDLFRYMISRLGNIAPLQGTAITDLFFQMFDKGWSKKKRGAEVLSLDYIDKVWRYLRLRNIIPGDLQSFLGIVPEERLDEIIIGNQQDTEKRKLPKLKWLHQRGYGFDVERMVHNLIGRGYLHSLKWVYETFRIEVDDMPRGQDVNFHLPGSLVYRRPPRYSNIELFEWLIENGLQRFIDNQKMYVLAFVNGNYRVMQWLLNHANIIRKPRPIEFVRGIMYEINYYKPVFDLVFTNFTRRLMNTSVNIMQLCDNSASQETIKALLQMELPPTFCKDGNIFEFVHVGNIGLIDYLQMSFQDDLDIRFYKEAAKYGHIGMLEYAFNKNCSRQVYGHFDQDDLVDEELVCKEAIETGHLGCFKWLIDHGFQYDANECMETADDNGYEYIAEYIFGLQQQQL